MTTPAAAAPVVAPEAPPAAPPPDAPDDRPPAWVAALMGRLDRLEANHTDAIKRIGKLNGKVKEGAGKAPDTTAPDGDAETKPAAGSKGVTPEDLAAAIKLGTVLAALPPKAREDLQGAVDAGDLSFTVALERATFLQAHLPATGGDTTTQGAKVPDGKPATGARSQGAATFKDWTAWLKYREERPGDAHAYMTANPDFTPSKLPGGPRQGR